ncbi:MAG: hypothetical protein V3U71_09835 [Cocleimonas sp.]
MNTTNKNIPEEAIKLLPWYATGWLSSEERTYVNKVLKEYPELQDQLDDELKMISLISKDKEVLELSSLEPSKTRLNEIFRTIDKDSIDSKKHDSSDIKARLKSWLPTSFNTQYASFAGVAILAVTLLFAFIAPLVLQEKNQQSDFEPATSEENKLSKNTTNATILLVGIKGSPEVLKTLAPLKDKLSKVEHVQGKAGMYKISLKSKLVPEKTQELIRFLLSQKEIVWFAGEAY